jgi:sugar lactone lactonase YvrE
VSKSGYDTVTANAKLAADALFTFSPSLYPANTTPATVELRAKVLDAGNNAPIAGAKMTVGSKTAASDADGNLTMTGLSAGAFMATLEASGYASVTLNGALIAGMNNIGDISLAELATASTLSGSVMDSASQKAISGAVVLMQGTGMKSVTDADGHYTLSGLSTAQATLYVSATGYFGRTVNATLGQSGHYTLDIVLDEATPSGISIDSVTTNASDYEPYSKVEAIATLSSITQQDVDVTVRALVIDSAGNIVQEIQANPGLGAVNPPDLPITVPADGSTAVPIDWHVLSALPGAYTLVVRASDLSGRVLVENSAAFKVLAATRIGGGITLDPPIAQASGEQPVHITANLANAGNQPSKVGTVQVAVTLENPDTGGPAVQKAGLKAFLEGSPLSAPRGGVFDAAGNLYVANASERKIIKIAPDGQADVFAAISMANSPGTLQDLAFDKAGNLLVLSSQNRIVKIALDEIQTVIDTGLSAQYGLAADASGKLYVSAGSNNSVKVFGASGSLLNTITGPQNPSGIALTASEQLLVAEANSTRVSTYNEQGAFESSLYGFSGPKGLTWTGSELIFSDSNNRIFSLASGLSPQLIGSATADYLAWSDGTLYLSSGNKLSTMAKNGTISAFYSNTGSNALSGLAVRSDGAVSFASRNDSRVITLDAGAKVIANYAGLRSPQGLMIDSGGSVYVSNSGLSNIVRIRADGKQSDIFSTGTSFRNLVSDSAGQIYATGGDSVYKLSSSGTSTKVASGGSTTNGIALLGSGIYITDGSASAVRVVNGNQLDIYASGLGSGYGVRADSDGGVYVAVENNGTVMRYADGKLALYAAGLTSPRVLAFDLAGNLYTGEKSGAISKIEGSGLKTDLGVSSLLSGKTIDGLAVDASNTLHITVASKNAAYKVIIPTPQADTPAGTVVYTATADVPELAVDGGPVPLDFGHWTPAFGGDFSIKITSLQPTVDGMLASSIHVGPHAYGTIAADKSELVPGQNSVGLQVKIKGADFTSLSKVDTANLKGAFSTGNIFPKTMPADRSGNAYLPVSGVIKRIAPDGQMSDFVALPGIADGTAMAIDSGENLYVYAGNSKKLMRIAQDGTYAAFASLSSSPVGMAVDSRDNVLVLVSNGILRFTQSGTQEFLGSAAVTNPYALTIDGHDNIYVQNTGNIITKITPDGSVSTLLSPDPKTNQPNFEYEGINIAGDCADNVFLTPLNWKEVGQSGEEHVLVQMIGKTGLASPILDGKTVKPALTDMDFVSYDRFSGNLFIWTDNGYKVYKLPVTCGAIGVDLHIMLPQGQSASGFNIAPASAITQPDGSTEYIWNLKDVTAFGQDVRFDTLLDGVALGDVRPLAKDAFLLFKNTFVPGDVRVPLAIPKLAANSLVGLAVTTDKPEYPAQTDAGITTDLVNPNTTAVNDLLKLAIFDAQGVLVKNVLTQAVAINPGSSVSVSPMPAFNTGDTMAGTYTVQALLENAEGVVLAQASTAFLIVGGSDGNPTLDAKVSVDKLDYNPIDSVNISARVHNLATNLLFDNLTVQETVKDAGGKTVYSSSQQIPQLLGGALRDLTFVYAQNNAAPGVYTLEQAVVDAAGTVLSGKTATFTVQPTSETGSGLKGQVGLSSEAVPAGDNLTISAQIQNLGNADLAALPLTLSIVDPATETVLATWSYSADIAQGDNFSAAASWPATSTGKTTYVAMLTATLGGKTLPLAQHSFTVADAIKLDVKQALLPQNHVLVLLACQPGEGSGHGHKSGKAHHDDHEYEEGHNHHDDHEHDQKHHDELANSCLDSRTAFIDALLTQLNLPHRVTVTAEDFRIAFRSGHYNTYWLSGGIDKLQDKLAEEIREAVNRGDSLLVDGLHDERNELLDEVVGVQYRGKLAPANQPVELTGPLFAAGSVVTRGRPLKLELDTGTLQARFPDNLDCDDNDDEKHHGSAADNPAIVSNRYGQGHGMILAFDLPATLIQAPPLPDVWQAILEAAFDELLPELPETYASGAWVVSKTTVANQGQAVDLQVTTTLPPDAQVISTEPAAQVDSTGTQAVWDFHLDPNQSQDLTLSWWLSGITGNYTLDTLVNTSQGKPYGSYPLTLTVASALDQQATDDLIAQLKALSFGSHKDRKARDKVVKSLQDALARTSSGHYEEAIDSLIDAVDRLNAIEGKQMSAYRLGLDRWLQGLEQQWQPAPLPDKSHKKRIRAGWHGH